jgi:lipoate-protein ligase A
MVVVMRASGASGAPVDANGLRRCEHAADRTNFERRESVRRRERSRATPLKIATRLVLWRLLLSPPLGGPENMALDEALMARARRAGETVLRTYAWATPTLSLGRHQRARGVYDEGALHDAGVEVVRRPTGGRALLHHREVTYSVTAPASDAGSVAQAYARINALLVDALALLGVPAEVATGGRRAPAPTAVPCFAEPSAGELVHDGRKLAGSAQWRDAGALLQHGSILVDDDQRTIGALLRSPSPAVPAPATLRGALGRAPSHVEVHEAFARAVEGATGTPAEPMELDARTLEEAGRLAERYRDADWTWRR